MNLDDPFSADQEACRELLKSTDAQVYSSRSLNSEYNARSGLRIHRYVNVFAIGLLDQG